MVLNRIFSEGNENHWGLFRDIDAANVGSSRFVSCECRTEFDFLRYESAGGLTLAWSSGAARPRSDGAAGAKNTKIPKKWRRTKTKIS